MADFRWSICLPDNREIIEKGAINKQYIIETFENFPWMDHLRKMATIKDEDIHYSPSIEFEDMDSKQGVTFSIVGDENNNEFYIFYKRPKTLKSFFGLLKKDVDEYVSDITGQTKEDAVDFLKAFLSGDTVYLETKMK